MDVNVFLAADKSMIIAPAGFGKTYTIAETIAAYDGSKQFLVLTHTHSGIASLKDKFNEKGISSKKYHLDTICSFALDLTKTYHIDKEEIPGESDVSAMFKFAIEHATRILRAKPIKKLLSVKYDHLIVDEYQDCSIAQHQMILELSRTIKTHILGDPLQGIFGFRNEPVVDFEDDSFEVYKQNSQTLDTPWRWNNAGNIPLGKDLARIREKLMTGEDVDLRDYQSLLFVPAKSQDYAIPYSECRKQIFRELKLGAVIIHPNSANIERRKAVVKKFHQLQLIEPIDGKDYYDCCLAFDALNGQPLIKAVADMMKMMCSKKPISIWINEHGDLVRKTTPKDLAVRKGLETIVTQLSAKKSLGLVAVLIDTISKLQDVAVYRKSFVSDMIKVLVDASKNDSSAIDALVRNRNIVRRQGRKILKNSIGTTLLTKGLEFENVVVLNAHEFKDPKHLYVALTRGSKRVVVIAENPVLHPYLD